MSLAFDTLIGDVKLKHELLVSAEKYSIGSLPPERAMPKSGIYLFSENGESLYVGRTNTIRKRLQNHVTNSHNKATFAFLLARHDTGNLEASYKPEGSRAHLLEQPEFRAAFDRARDRIRGMDIQFVEEVDPIKQTILEVYAAFETQAKYNDFDNH